MYPDPQEYEHDVHAVHILKAQLTGAGVGAGVGGAGVGAGVGNIVGAGVG